MASGVGNDRSSFSSVAPEAAFPFSGRAPPSARKTGCVATRTGSLQVNAFRTPFEDEWESANGWTGFPETDAKAGDEPKSALHMPGPKLDPLFVSQLQ